VLKVPAEMMTSFFANAVPVVLLIDDDYEGWEKNVPRTPAEELVARGSARYRLCPSRNSTPIACVVFGLKSTRVARQFVRMSILPPTCGLEMRYWTVLTRKSRGELRWY